MSTAAFARTACASYLEHLVRIVSAVKVDLSNEKAAQAAMEFALLDEIDAECIRREHRLGPGDIPDFLVFGSIVLELKGPRHRPGPVLRQLQRYAAYPQVTGLVLATARAMRLPGSIGKPLRVVNLGRAWL